MPLPLTDLCIFTANADATLRLSAVRLGLNLQSYAVDPWPGYVSGKLRLGVQFLATRTEPYAMWIDGHDTLLLKRECDILDRLRAMGDPTLIAAERTCWPDNAQSNRYPAGVVGAPRFLNAGGFIGRRGNAMTAMHTAIQASPIANEDDQMAWTDAILSGAMGCALGDDGGVQIDYGRRIFSSEGDGDTAAADPCVRHWNGRVAGRGEFWEGLNVIAD